MGVISTLEYAGILWILYLGLVSFQDAGSFKRIFSKKSLIIILQTFFAILLLTSLHELFILPVLFIVLIKQKIDKYVKAILSLIIVIGIAYLLFFGIKPNEYVSQKYDYCWNKYTLKRNLFGLDKHHYGYQTIGDHICTDKELGINNYSSSEKYN